MIAIIPARGGSKGLPGKNIKALNDKPLIAYTIEAALNSKKITRVIVSTDDTEIAVVSMKYGAEVPFMRPDDLATDTARSVDAYNYTIQRLEREEDISVKEIIVLQPTSPFRTSQHIDEAIELYLEKKADSVISYCQEQHPIFWHKYVTLAGKLEEIFEGDFIKNRQEVSPTFYPNGAIYIFSTDILLENKYYTSNSYAYIMEADVSVDIDTQMDWEFANFLIERKKRSTNN